MMTTLLNVFWEEMPWNMTIFFFFRYFETFIINLHSISFCDIKKKKKTNYVYFSALNQ